MSAREHLSPLQFKYSEDKEKNYSMIEAHHPEHGEVGYMSWAKKDTGLHQPGEIANIVVHDPALRRKGVATAIYNNAISEGYSPSPLHSQHRTATHKGRSDLGGGKKWVDSVGGPAVKPRKIK